MNIARSAAPLASTLFLASLTLAGPVSGQSAADGSSAARTHTVERGDTLWRIAERYLGSGFEWRRIADANPSAGTDPSALEIGALLTIPAASSSGTPGSVGAVSIAPGQSVGAADPAPAADEPPALLPTVFRESLDTRVGISVAEAELRPRPAAPPFSILSAPVLSDGSAPGRIGEIERVSGLTIRPGVEPVAGPYSDLMVRFEGEAAPAIGTLLVAMRPGSEIPGHGSIVHPTGILEVVERQGAAGVVRLVRPFGVVEAGQWLTAIPEALLPEGLHPLPTEDGTEGRIIALADLRPLPLPGDVVFVALEGPGGARPGDLLAAYAPGGSVDGRGNAAGRLQVVAVGASGVSARILSVTAPGIEVGAGVRIVARMP